jgi:hypothetical protein
MRIIRYQDPAAFQRRVLPLLMRNEAMNNLMIGVLTDVVNGTQAFALLKHPLFCAVENEAGEVIAAAKYTRSHLVLTDADPLAIDALVDDLSASAESFPAACGPLQTVRRFIECWASRAGQIAVPVPGHRMRIMQLESVTPGPQISGDFRAATVEDLPVLQAWGQAFNEELKFTNSSEAIAIMQKRVADQRAFVWCDPQPVSMACTAGPTPNGMRVNWVYTPQENRRRGYARACVTHLSQRLLDAGRKIVFLYVDADNPTTNRIYSQIGYKALGDWEDWDFPTHATK